MKKFAWLFIITSITNPLFSEVCNDSSCSSKKDKTVSKTEKEQPSNIIPIPDIDTEPFIQKLKFIQMQLPCIIKVGASWCKPCKKAAPEYEKIAQNYRPLLDAVFFSITVNEKPALESKAITYLTTTLHIQIHGIPAFIILYRDEVHVIEGSDNVYQIQELLTSLITKYPRTKAITSKTIDKLIYSSKKPVVLKLHAYWCPPCSFMEPIFEHAEKKFKKRCHFYRLDTTEDPELAQHLMTKHKIEGIPCFLCYKNGIVTKKFAGGKSEEDFIQEIQEFLNN